MAVSPFTACVIKKQNHINGDYNVSAAFLILSCGFASGILLFIGLSLAC